MTTEEKIIKNKRELPNLAQQFGMLVTPVE